MSEKPLFEELPLLVVRVVSFGPMISPLFVCPRIEKWGRIAYASSPTISAVNLIQLIGLSEEAAVCVRLKRITPDWSVKKYR